MTKLDAIRQRMRAVGAQIDALERLHNQRPHDHRRLAELYAEMGALILAEGLAGGDEPGVADPETGAKVVSIR